MVFFNYTTMQVSAKIVYYGPGLCGKTTNLQQIHQRTDPSSRGEMVSLETEADRTLFFDLLPLEVGTIGGMRVRLQLYTVPGQVFYNTTRKLVLKGVDGIVFVADSQIAALDANFESLRNLHQNMEELNQPIDRIPFVIQLNKRDLRNIHPADYLNRTLNQDGRHEVYEAAALHGIGVFETLKAISKKTLASVHRKISGQEPRRDRSFSSGPGRHATAARRGAPGETKTAAPSGGAAVVSADTGEVRTNTAEVRVEFAAREERAARSPSPPRGGAAPSKVATRSHLDIERELDQLRQMALGKTGSKSLEPSARELQREVKLRLPRSVLLAGSELTLDVNVRGAGADRFVPGALRVDLPGEPAGEPIRLRITLDIEEANEER